jgi:hypothetical protein
MWAPSLVEQKCRAIQVEGLLVRLFGVTVLEGVGLNTLKLKGRVSAFGNMPGQSLWNDLVRDRSCRGISARRYDVGISLAINVCAFQFAGVVHGDQFVPFSH